jgi:signal transduction histidine kinase
MDSLWNIFDPIHATTVPDAPLINKNHNVIRFLFNNTADPVVVVRLDNLLIEDVNTAACERFNYGPQRFKGMNLNSIVVKPLQLKRTIKHKSASLTEVECLCNEKLRITANLYFAYPSTGDHQRVIILFRDIIDDNATTKEKIKWETLTLEATKTESAFFLGEENERQRLARELHGNIGPLMLSVKMGLEQLLSGNKKMPPAEDCQKLLELQTQAIRELRIATSRLAEGYLYQEDINKAIENLLQKYSELSDLRIYSKKDGLPGNLNIAFRYHLFRIIEESLTNAVIHSNASKISFRLWISNKMLYMYIMDNGHGMNRPILDKDRGLWLMQQRAKLLNGAFQIETVPGKYFRVSLEASIM